MNPTHGEMYLDLLKKVLTRIVAPEQLVPVGQNRTWQARLGWPLLKILAANGYCLARPARFDVNRRLEGEDWPAEAETMIGLKRLDNIHYCMSEIIRNGIPGDVIETGVWRGGACIFMRAVLAVAGDTERRVWVADSFEGLPKASVAADTEDAFSSSAWEWNQLSVSLEAVRGNFAKYGLLDDQVQFLKGWFKDTLPAAPIERLSLLRLDGDMYESTWDAISVLYPKLSPGGYAIVDDYSTWPACKQAVDDYRRQNGISDPIIAIDKPGVFWQKS